MAHNAEYMPRGENDAQEIKNLNFSQKAKYVDERAILGLEDQAALEAKLAKQNVDAEVERVLKPELNKSVYHYTYEVPTYHVTNETYHVANNDDAYDNDMKQLLALRAEAGGKKDRSGGSNERKKSIEDPEQRTNSIRVALANRENYTNKDLESLASQSKIKPKIQDQLIKQLAKEELARRLNEQDEDMYYRAIPNT